MTKSQNLSFLPRTISSLFEVAVVVLCFASEFFVASEFEDVVVVVAVVVVAVVVRSESQSE
jgi:hypothetical protein